MLKILLKSCVFWLLFIGLPGASSYNTVRIAYINSCNNFDPVTNLPSVPAAFLERAKKANYTHVMVEFYILEPGDWNAQGDYRNHHYAEGSLYLMLKGIIGAVHAGGLKIIPCINVPGGRGLYPWWPALAKNKNLDGYNLYPDKLPCANSLPCIASGLTRADGSRLQPDGFEHVFIETMKVLYAAYDSTYSEKLEYIHIGYSECFYDTAIIWGTGAAGRRSGIDREWINSNKLDASFLAMRSIQRRAANIRSIDTKFSTTRVIVFGDMFSKTFQMAKGRNCVITTSLPSNADAEFKKQVVVMPWWYDRHYDRSDPKSPLFNTVASFDEFAKNNIDLLYMACATQYTPPLPPTELELCPSYIAQLFDYVTTAKTYSLQNKILGFAAAHWNTSSYNPTRLVWNTMEFLAYGNQVARPKTGLSAIPPGIFGSIKINRLLCSQTEITQGDFLAVTGKFMFNGNRFTGRLDHPVENMTLYDAVLYCNLRSGQEGLIPVYSYDPPKSSDLTGEYGETCRVLNNLKTDTSKNGYRLPSPAEWQYIYRAGSTTDYYWGATYDTSYYWCDKSPQITMPVGLKKPNKWDIYDIAGNVAELTCEYNGGTVGSIKSTGGSTGAYAASPVFKCTSKLQDVDLAAEDPRVGFRVVRKAADAAK